MRWDEADVLELLGRRRPLFEEDIGEREERIRGLVEGARFLVVGGGGSIGQAVAREIFKRDPRVLHVIDLSENGLVELVRDLRSSMGYGSGELRTLPLDVASRECEAFLGSQEPYHYVLNLSALKHVRSEKDPYCMMRMLRVNVLNAEALAEAGAKYFCVSTDKAANPASAMGASKRIMEMLLMARSPRGLVSLARFANVAFSDGSLLHGFTQRIAKGQPLSAPRDIGRYFMTGREAGELCLLACLFGEDQDIFFPKVGEELSLVRFDTLAGRFLERLGYEAYVCQSEEEARGRANELIPEGKWPCYFFLSDTTGEKEAEEFYSQGEVVDLGRFRDIGVIACSATAEPEQIERFRRGVAALLEAGTWTREELLALMASLVPTFKHRETGKYLDQRM